MRYQVLVAARGHIVSRMSNREASISVRYVISVVDKGVAKAMALTKDFSKQTEIAGKAVDASLKLQEKQWGSLARIAEQADAKITTSQMKASVQVSKATETAVASLRKQGVAYETIVAKQRAAGRSASELASAIERSAGKEIAAMDKVRMAAEKPVRQRMSQASMPGTRAANRLSGGVRSALYATAAFGGYQGITSSVESTQARLLQARQIQLSGFSSPQAQALAATTQAMGVDPRTLSMSLRTLSTQATHAMPPPGSLVKPAKASQQAFKQLGISPQELSKQGGDTYKILGLVADAMKKGKHNAADYSAAASLLGRGFSKLNPLLGEGSKGLNEYVKEAEHFGVVTKGSTQEQLLQMHKRMIEVKLATMGLQTSIAENLAPALIKVIPVVASLVHGLAQALTPAVHTVKAALKPLIGFFKSNQTAMSALKGAASALAAGLVGVLVINKVRDAFLATEKAIKSLRTAMAALNVLNEQSKIRTLAAAAATKVAEVATAAWSGVIKALRTAMTALNVLNEQSKIRMLATAAATKVAAAATKVAEVATAAWSGATRAAAVVMNLLKTNVIASTVATVAQRVAAAASAVATGVWAAAQTAFNAVMALFKTNVIASTVAMVAQRVAMVATTAATKAWAAAQALLNIAMDANPIGLVILAIAGLVVAVVEAYKHFKTFRDIVQEVGKVCVQAGQDIMQGLGVAFDWVKHAVGEVVGFVGQHWKLLLPILAGPFAPVVAIAEGFGPQVFGAIKSAFDSIVGFLGGLPSTFASAATSIFNAFTGVFNGLGSTIEGLFKGALNLGIAAVNTAISGINTVTGALASVGGPNLSIQAIPPLAEGGYVMGTGGLMPAMVSPGEQIVHAGRSVTVPGTRVAADNTFAMLPHGAAVMTGHGQQLMAAGHSMDDAISMQLPHFASGGWASYDAAHGGSTKGHGRSRGGRSRSGRSRGSHPRVAHHATVHRPHELTITGPVSTFGPPGEGAGTTAYGGSSADAGIALNPSPPDGWNGALAQSLAGKLFHVAVAGHQANLKVIDKGPHAQGAHGWRQIDITGAGAKLMGLNPASFPTDAIGKATMVVGGAAKATKAVTAKALKAAAAAHAGPSLANQTGVDPAAAFQTGFDAGLKGDALSSTSAVSDAIKAVAVQIPNVSPGGVSPSAPSPLGNRGVAKRAKTTGGSAFSRMVAEAGAINAKQYNYEWAGGHNPTFSPTHGVGHGSGPGIGYDCSGSVSRVLHAAGALTSPLDSTGLMSYGQSGPGKRVSIFASPTHTVMSLAGRFFGTSSHGHGGGASWMPGQPESFPATRHPPGLRRGGFVGTRHGGSVGDISRRLSVLTGSRSRGPSILSRATKDFGVLGSAPDANVSGLIGATLTKIAGLVQGATVRQLDRTVASVQAALRGHHSAIQTRRLQSALAILEAQIGNRLGLMANAVQVSVDQIAKRNTVRSQGLRVAGIDPSSSAGLLSEQRQNTYETLTLQANARRLTTIMAQARHTPMGAGGRVVHHPSGHGGGHGGGGGHRGHGGLFQSLGRGASGGHHSRGGHGGHRSRSGGRHTGAPAGVLTELQTQLDAVNAQLAESVKHGVELIRDLIKAKAQEGVDAANHAANMASGAGDYLSAIQRNLGTAGTPNGLRAQSAQISQQVLPAMQAQLSALEGQLAAARRTGDASGVMAAQEAVQKQWTDIANKVADAADLLKQAAHDQQAAVEAAATGQTSLDQARLAGMKIRDVFGTGGAARGDFINKTVIPDLQKEQQALNQRYAADRGNGSTVAQLLQDQIDLANKNNEISQAGVDATNEVASNTNPLKNQAGTLALAAPGSGSQIETDLSALGVGL